MALSPCLDDPPSSRGSLADGEGRDLFSGDEEAVGGLLKSLISTKGIQSAWQRVAKRLQIAERGLRDAQERLERVPQECVTRAEWEETVLKAHHGLLQRHGERLEVVEEKNSAATSRLDRQEKRLDECLSRTAQLEQWRNEISPTVHGVQEICSSLQADTKAALRAAEADLAGFKRTLDVDFAKMKESTEGDVETMRRHIADMEARMREYTEGEVKKVMDQLYSAGEEEEGPSPQQALMLEFVNTNLVSPIKEDLAKAGDRLATLFSELGRTRDETARQLRSMEKAHVDAQAKLKQSTDALQVDSETRVSKGELATQVVALSATLGDLEGRSKQLNNKVLTKLNECMDHFVKLHDTMDDHEHCLRHHAEEIENRGTKYDILLCQNQIDKCARKEEITRETTEIRKVLTWNTNKIESFALAMSGLGSSKVARGRQKRSLRSSRSSRRVGSRMSKPASRAGSLSSSRERLSPLESQHHESRSGDSSRASNHAKYGTGGETPTVKGDLPPVMDSEEELDAEVDVRELRGSKETEQSRSKSASDSEEDLLYDEEEEEEEDDDFVGASTLMRQQLEALSMGLVGLAALVLREPKLGMNRDARLRQEKDLLDELQNLRHWVTNRSAPAGWDPAKITTVALSCAHPREDQVKGPLPQVSLKGIMQEEKRQMRRNPSNDALRIAAGTDRQQLGTVAAPSAPHTSRAKMAGASGWGGAAEGLVKAPMSARGPGEIAGGRSILPPLHATALVS